MIVAKIFGTLAVVGVVATFIAAAGAPDLPNERYAITAGLILLATVAAVAVTAIAFVWGV